MCFLCWHYREALHEEKCNWSQRLTVSEIHFVSHSYCKIPSSLGAVRENSVFGDACWWQHQWREACGSLYLSELQGCLGVLPGWNWVLINWNIIFSLYMWHIHQKVTKGFPASCMRQHVCSAPLLEDEILEWWTECSPFVSSWNTWSMF